MDQNNIDVPIEMNNQQKRRSFPTWLSVMLVCIFAAVMALPLLQLWWHTTILKGIFWVWFRCYISICNDVAICQITWYLISLNVPKQDLYSGRANEENVICILLRTLIVPPNIVRPNFLFLSACLCVIPFVGTKLLHYGLAWTLRKGLVILWSHPYLPLIPIFYWACGKKSYCSEIYVPISNNRAWEREMRISKIRQRIKLE